jgi:hypothetical protein
MSSIIFGGLKTKNNINYIVFTNSENVSVEIPIEKVSADRIEKYLSRICPASVEKPNPSPDNDIRRCSICLRF